MNPLRTIAALLLISTAALAQETVTVTAPAPPPPASIGASYSGQPGPASYYYWVSAVYPGGESGVAGPAVVRGAANTLSGANTVSVSWSAAFGATSYNVIRTLTPTFSSNCSSCLLASGVTATTAADTGAALSSYSGGSSAAPATAGLAVNVRDYATPRLELRLNGRVVGSFDSVGIASGTPNVVFGGDDGVVFAIEDDAGNTVVSISTAGLVAGQTASFTTAAITSLLADAVNSSSYALSGAPLGYQHLDGSPPLAFNLAVLESDATVSTGDGVAEWIVPSQYNGYALTSVVVHTYTAGAGGSMTTQIAKCVSVSGAKCSSTVSELLSTIATIDAGESSTLTAATPLVIDTAADVNVLATGDVLRFDVDSVHSTTAAKGLTYILGFTAP